MRIRTVFSLSLSMIVAGCAIRPLPRDVTRDTTLEIVTKIRCEAREAIIYELMDVIVEIGSERNKKTIRTLLNGKVDANFLEQLLGNTGANREVLVELLVKNVTIWQLRRLTDSDVSMSKNSLFPGTLERINRFRSSTIGYTFRFLIKEQNNRSGKGIITMPFTGGTFTLGFGAGVNKNRDNERKIVVSDTFSKLVTRLNCTDGMLRQHWIYPITGNIGMREVLYTFTETVKRGGVSKLFDKLTFKTKFLGNLDPKVVLSAPIQLKKVKLTEASLTIADEREDLHEVELVLKVAAGVSALESVILGTDSKGRTVKLKYKFPEKGGSSAEEAYPRGWRDRDWRHGQFLPPISKEESGELRGAKSLLGISKKESDILEKDIERELQIQESLSISREIRDLLPTR